MNCNYATCHAVALVGHITHMKIMDPSLSGTKLISLLSLMTFGLCQKVEVYEQCGIEMNCLGLGRDKEHTDTCMKDKSCLYVVGAHFDTTTNALETLFYSSATTQNYLAIGISDDQRMGDDDVIAFVGLGGNRPVFVSGRTSGKSGVDDEAELTPASKPVVRLFNGGFEVESNFDISSLPAEFKFKNFKGNVSYFLFIAVGSVSYTNSQYNLQYHSVGKVVSGAPVHFASVTELKADTVQYLEIKVHGCCMILVWTFIIPVAIVISRYYKETWAHVRFFKRRLWFTAHVGLMLLSLMIALAGYLAIIVKNKGIFHNPQNHTGLPIHQAIGFVAIVLMILQSVGNWRRFSDPVFKTLLAGAHTLFGVTAYISGIYNIMMAEVLVGDLLGLTRSLQYFPLVSFLLLVVFFIAMSSFYSWTDSHLSVSVTRALCSYPLRVSSDEEAPRPALRKRILLGFILVTSMITTIYAVLFFLL